MDSAQTWRFFVKNEDLTAGAKVHLKVRLQCGSFCLCVSLNDLSSPVCSQVYEERYGVKKGTKKLLIGSCTHIVRLMSDGILSLTEGGTGKAAQKNSGSVVSRDWSSLTGPKGTGELAMGAGERPKSAKDRWRFVASTVRDSGSGSDLGRPIKASLESMIRVDHSTAILETLSDGSNRPSGTLASKVTRPPFSIHTRTHTHSAALRAAHSCSMTCAALPSSHPRWHPPRVPLKCRSICPAAADARCHRRESRWMAHPRLCETPGSRLPA